MTQELFCLIVGLVLVLGSGLFIHWVYARNFEPVRDDALLTLGGWGFFAGVACIAAVLLSYASHLPSMWGGR